MRLAVTLPSALLEECGNTGVDSEISWRRKHVSSSSAPLARGGVVGAPSWQAVYQSPPSVAVVCQCLGLCYHWRELLKVSFL